MGCSNDNYWKLDKWDKIGIASLILFFTLFVVLNTFCFADTNLSKGVLDNCNISNGVIIEGNIYIVYYELISGHTYKIISNREDTSLTLRFTKEVPNYGVSYFDTLTLDIGATIEYSFNSDSRYLFVILPVASALDSFSVVDISNGQILAVSSLVDNVSPSSLWSVFNNAIPYILVVVLVVFGIYLISHAIREISKGRDI